MTKNSRTLIKGILLTIAAALISMQGAANAQKNEDVPETLLTGVWRTITVPRNCSTGAPMPNAIFEGLMTFHGDGTISAWLQNSTITTTRSPIHGVWRRDTGWDFPGETTYLTRVIHMRYNLSTGAFIGRQESQGSFVLNHSSDTFTSDSTTTVFDANGIPTGTSCANSSGTRFTLN